MTLLRFGTSPKLDALNRSQAVIEFKPDGTILTANENFLKTVGYSLAEIQGRHHSLFVDTVERESSDYRAFWAALARGEVHRAEYRRIGKDGLEVWLQAAYTPILGRNGRTVGVVTFAVDVTAEKLRKADTLSQIEAIGRSQGVIEFALDGTILSANANFLDLVGYTLEAVKGQHHRMFVDPEERDGAAYRTFWEALGQGTFQAGEFRRVGAGDARSGSRPTTIRSTILRDGSPRWSSSPPTSPRRSGEARRCTDRWRRSGAPRA